MAQAKREGIQTFDYELVDGVDGLVLAGPITITVGCVPCRIVWRKLEGEHVTHLQLLELVDGTTWRSRGYTWGHYFKDEKEAEHDFNDRIRRGF